MLEECKIIYSKCYLGKDEQFCLDLIDQPIKLDPKNSMAYHNKGVY